jgi:hypothetical protein
LQESAGTYDDFSVVAHWIEPVQADGALVGATKTKKCLDDGGFSGAVWPQQCDDFAIVDVQRDVVHGVKISEIHVELVDLYGVTHA